jgi:hypothetical protein
MKRLSLTARISREDLADYLSWRLSSAEIAKRYNSVATYVVRTLPKRPPKEVPDKSKLRAARKEFRLSLATKIDNGILTTKDAAEVAHCSMREMYRCLATVRKAKHAG